MNIDDVYDGRKVSELIAEGEYKSSKEEILRGFKIFQKKYVYKSVAVQMTLVVLAIITQLVNIVMGADRDVSFSWMLVVFCVILGGYLLMRPKNVYRKLDSSSTFFAGRKPWEQKVDIAMPCATQNELDGEDAKQLIANGVKVV